MLMVVVVMVMISGATTTTTALNVAVSLNAWQLRGLADEQHATAGGRAGNLSAFGSEPQSAYISSRIVQELDFFEMSQSKPEEKEVAAKTTGQPASAPGISQPVGHPSLAVSVAPPAAAPSLPASSQPTQQVSRRRVILSSDDDDDAPLATFAAPLPARKSLVPVDASGGCSVESQPLIIIGSSSVPSEQVCSPAAAPLGDIVSRDLRRMSVANGTPPRMQRARMSSIGTGCEDPHGQVEEEEDDEEEADSFCSARGQVEEEEEEEEEEDSDDFLSACSEYESDGADVGDGAVEAHRPASSLASPQPSSPVFASKFKSPAAAPSSPPSSSSSREQGPAAAPTRSNPTVITAPASSSMPPTAAAAADMRPNTSAPPSGRRRRIVISSDDDDDAAASEIVQGVAAATAAEQSNCQANKGSGGSSFLSVTKPMSSLSFEDVLRYNVCNRCSSGTAIAIGVMCHFFSHSAIVVIHHGGGGGN
jgi:hypothetical protein